MDWKSYDCMIGDGYMDDGDRNVLSLGKTDPRHVRPGDQGTL
jgi:hypothetical protein